MTAYVIPLIFIAVIVVAVIWKKQPYPAFVEGAAKALDLIKAVFPYLLAVMVAVEIMRVSGFGQILAKFVSPAFSIIGLPPELAELILVRPLSGAGAMGILDGIFAQYGADSYIGNCASIVYGSSETVFYLSSVYFSKCKVKGLGKGIIFALISNFIGYSTGCLLLKAFY